MVPLAFVGHPWENISRWPLPETSLSCVMTSFTWVTVLCSRPFVVAQSYKGNINIIIIYFPLTGVTNSRLVLFGTPCWTDTMMRHQMRSEIILQPTYSNLGFCCALPLMFYLLILHCQHRLLRILWVGFLNSETKRHFKRKDFIRAVKLSIIMPDSVSVPGRVRCQRSDTSSHTSVSVFQYAQILTYANGYSLGNVQAIRTFPGFGRSFKRACNHREQTLTCVWYRPSSIIHEKRETEIRRAAVWTWHLTGWRFKH